MPETRIVCIPRDEWRDQLDYWRATVIHPVMRRVILAFLVLLTATPALAQQDQSSVESDTTLALQSLDEELSRLETDTVLLVQSQAVDEFPVWSPDGSRLAANVAGTWYSIRIDSVALVAATWRGGQSLGVLNSGKSIAEAPEAAMWQEQAKFAPRSIKTASGTTVELRQNGLSTAFVITSPDTQAETLWTSEYENCHSLTLSPSEHYVAFICEMNGVLLYKLDPKDRPS